MSYFFEYLRKQGKAKLAKKDKATKWIYSSKGLLKNLLNVPLEGDQIAESRSREPNKVD